MASRLGHVLYWIGNICAVLLIVAGATMFFLMIRSTNATDVSSAPVVGGLIAASALIPWGAGKALRYVLSGS